MADALKKFGKYFLLDMIAQGGMAEIYRARMATLDGGGRLLAVKRIIGNYSENKEFVDMFKSEIKTTSGFTHPNIVQLYDYGEENGMLYIAMELVDGKNLRQFIGRFHELKQTFPVEVSVYIMEQAAHGMGYAHSYKDKISGKSLNIVHRDISPQNLLISYDGAVKVIDFGIAKATTNNEATRAGVIKGKPSYLSPEQISGEVLDGRSDIFALGIVLWELLTGKKLFASDNDYGVLKLIENCTNHVKPPSMFNPKVPKELDAIVMKTLQKNRDHRYATAEEMQRALHKFLYQFAPEFNPADLAYYARDLFKNEIVEDRKRLLKLNEKVEQLLTQPVAEAPVKEEPQPERVAPKVLKEESVPFNKEAPELEHTKGTQKPSAQPKAPGAPGKPAERNTGSFRTVDFKGKEKTEVTLDFTPGTGSVAKPGVPGAGRASTNTNTKITYATSSTSTKLLHKPGTGTGLRRPGADSSSKSPIAAAIALLVLGGGYYYYENVMTAKPEATRTVAQETGEVVIEGNVKAATVSVDGKELTNALPAHLKGLPAGKPLKITVFSNGYETFNQVVTLGAGETKNIMAALSLPNSAGSQASGSTGAPGVASGEAKPVSLRVVVNPPGFGTMIKVNNQATDASGIITVQTSRPIELIVERDGFRTVKQNFSIDPSALGGKTEWVQEINLQQAKFGFVSIKTTPSGEALITVDGVEEKWQIPVSRKRLPVGTYKVRLVNSLLGMEKDVTFTINEDRFTNIEERLSVTGDSNRMPGSN